MVYYIMHFRKYTFHWNLQNIYIVKWIIIANFSNHIMSPTLAIDIKHIFGKYIILHYTITVGSNSDLGVLKFSKNIPT